MRFHSSSDLFFQSLDICGCKEEFIIVAIVHGNVKLQGLKSYCVFLHRPSLFEGDQLINCITVVISPKLLLYDLIENLQFRYSMILLICLPPFGGIALLQLLPSTSQEYSRW